MDVALETRSSGPDDAQRVDEDFVGQAELESVDVRCLRDDASWKLDRPTQAEPSMRSRVLHGTLPSATDDSEHCGWFDDKIVAGRARGWDLGDGHLQALRPFDALRRRCGFEPGEPLVVIADSPPLGGATMVWTIPDAAPGSSECDTMRIADAADPQPRPTGADAAAFARTSSTA